MSALTGAMPAGTPLTLPPGGPTPTSISYTNWEVDLGAALSGNQDALSVEAIGALRVEVLRRLAKMPPSDDPPSDEIYEGVYRLAAETVRTVGHLARQLPRPAMLWNQELDVAQFLGRTLLLADHVLYPDRLFDTLRAQPTVRRMKENAEAQLASAELLSSGIAIPVPAGVAMAAQGPVAQKLTAHDLKMQALVTWVRGQLIIEGPTAREALFVRAADDLAQEAADFWLHGRIARDSVDRETGRFATMMLQPYDAEYDYEPWIDQVRNSAISRLVQRTNERVVAADVFGTEYVSASLFEARLLRTREREARIGPAQSALLADIPELTTLRSPDLAKLLRNEDAIEDLRRQVRAALATARTDAENIDAISDLAHQLEAASHKLEKISASDLAWKAAIPGGLAGASMLVGGITGGLIATGIGALGALATLAPYLGDRLNSRRDAAYVFVAARRARK